MSQQNEEDNFVDFVDANTGIAILYLEEKQEDKNTAAQIICVKKTRL